MEISQQDAKYIQLLNQSNKVLERNITVLETSIRAMDDTLNRVARDSAALQRAIIEFMKLKDIIKTDDDLRLLQKLHMRHISQLDQEIAERKEKHKKDPT